jgi:hypothetical protein
VPTRRLVLVDPPITRLLVPGLDWLSKMNPAVAVLLPPMRTSLVEVLSWTVLFTLSSVQTVRLVEAGQLVPFARQTDCPEMTREEPEALVKARVVAVAEKAKRLVLELVMMLLVVAKNVVAVAFVAWRLVRREVPVAVRFLV